MTAPSTVTPDNYTDDVSLQMMTSVRVREQFSTFTAANATTLRNPTSISNDGTAAGYIAIQCIDDDDYLLEWFERGQEKMRRVASIGSTGDGTGAGINLVTIHES